MLLNVVLNSDILGSFVKIFPRSQYYAVLAYDWDFGNISIEAQKHRGQLPKTLGTPPHEFFLVFFFFGGDTVFRPATASHRSVVLVVRIHSLGMATAIHQTPTLPYL